MKRTSRMLILALLLILALGASLIACDPADDSPANTTAQAVTTEPTEHPATEPPETEAPATETPATEAPETTAPETLPETEAEPSLMTVVDMSGKEGTDLTAHFARLSKCEVTMVEDEAEGRVLRMSSKSIVTVGASVPAAYVEMADLVAELGGILPATTEYPYLVMKVRADVWSRSVTYYGGTSIRDAGNMDGYARVARLADTADWQYILLDLSEQDKDLTVLYLNFERGAAKDGEYMDIAEMRFFATKEEAAALAPVEDVYPIVEQSPEDYTLKVMSFNVQTENGTKVDFGLRADMLRDLLDELQPDSIGMQEVTVRWIEWMDSFSFNQSYAGVGEGRTAGGEASSIYYRKDKYDLVDYGTFWLSETPDQVGSALPNANYPRICTWAHLRDKTTGFEYIHLNTHLDHNGNNSSSDGRALRTAQVRVILEFIQTLPDVPMVLTGDFNQAKTNSEENIYAMFKNVLGLGEFTSSTGEKITGNFSDARADAADTVGSDAWASMTSSWQEGDKYNPGKKPIDYVFYTAEDFDAMVYRNIHYHRDGIYMSDHLPQYCELHVKVAAAE